ncbi:DUF5363 family protein [Paraferrimonas sedimenticola]|uniref:DUF5363 family protein n=1 Tax=Paraferrimonas sedimenticola TaxID=375674 RepID=UPI000BA99F7D|nr:DUF5363 family protein [Paraferrimonas sedimenticola]
MIKKLWNAYTRWCDEMGLTPENKRCCAPMLQDPPLKKADSKLSPKPPARNHDR